MATAVENNTMPLWLQRLDQHRGVVVPLAFLMLVIVILVPLPPFIMDMLIAFNIALAVVVLMTTMYMTQALDFSVFPSLLLGATLLRLVLNVASTRLILTADASTPEEAIGVAGKVISTFGTFVAGGNIVVGVILFLILIIVQFMVITKGATRISEVAARFTLDAMPGKQMAIDADLNAGLLDEAEARRRRELVSREADFFGAMDGAAKFVRGDAIAGLLITTINILGGFTIGWLMKGWTVMQSAEVFTKLTIGDGLASQIPAFIIAIAAALIVTRSGTDKDLGTEMTSQLMRSPMALALTSGFISVLALTPLPAAPLLTLGVGLGGASFMLARKNRAVKRAEVQRETEETEALPTTPAVEELLKVDTLELEIGYGLVSLVDANQGGDLLDRISAIRRQIAAEWGLVMPPVRIRDNMTLPPTNYRIKIRGSVVAEGESRPGMLMAMDSGIASGSLEGEQTIEPAFGLSARWISPEQRSRAESMNYTVVDPTSVLTTHLAEIVKTYADELLTREEVNNLIEQLKERSPRLIEDVVPSVISMGELQKVLQSLLRERVPIRDLETILETLSDWATKTKDLEVLTEYVRNALRRAICLQYSVPVVQAERVGISPEPGRSSKMKISCVTLDPGFEDLIAGYIDRSPAGTVVTMPSAVANMVANQIATALEPVTAAGYQPVIIASPQVRAQVKQILEPHLPSAVVLGYNEIEPGIEVESMGLVMAPVPEPAVAGSAA